ncbi:hypothetical protein TL16_g00986 [Triparma laevis f. inornata]|uniref:TOG domain-containing protein n=1 Tax=Triparma laevis f. inornata TaxID=1714386 RepID=A0A9W6ZF36_9STRA|nr:hypothetical protein TL16_g00986 [Triparma laevis f. inornata]
MADLSALLNCSTLAPFSRVTLLSSLYAPLTFRPFSIPPPDSHPDTTNLSSYLSTTSTTLTGLIAKSKGANKTPLLTTEKQSNHLITFLSCLIRSSVSSPDVDSDSTTPPLVKNLASILSLYCTVLLSSNDTPAAIAKFTKTVNYRVIRILRRGHKRSEVIKPSPLITSTLEAIAVTGTGRYGIAMSLLSAMEENNSDSSSFDKNQVLAAFMKSFIIEKNHNNLLALTRYITLTVSNSDYDSKTKLCTSFKMKFKSTPETALNCFNFFVLSSTPGFITEKFIDDVGFIDAMLKGVKSPNPEVNALTSECYKAVVSISTTSNLRNSILAEYVKSNAQKERTLFLDCLDYELKQPALQPYTNLDVDALCKGVAKEVNDENKVKGYKLLTKVCKKYPSLEQTPVTSLLSSSVKSPPAKMSASQSLILKAQLDGLCELSPSLPSLKNDLLKIVESAKSKTTPQLESIMALRLLTSDPSNVEEVKSAFTDEKSFLYSQSLRDLNDDYLRHVLECIKNYINSEQEPEILVTNKQSTQTIASLCLHTSSGKVRSYARGLLSPLLSSSDTVPTPLEPTTAIFALSSSLKSVIISKQQTPPTSSTKRAQKEIRTAWIEPCDDRPKTVKYPQNFINKTCVEDTARRIIDAKEFTNPVLAVLAGDKGFHVLQDKIEEEGFSDELANELINCLQSNCGMLIKAATSFIHTITEKAAAFDPEFDDPEEAEPGVISYRNFITNTLASTLNATLQNLSTSIKEVSEDDLNLYKFPTGELYDVEEESKKGSNFNDKKNAKRDVKNRKGKGNFGADFEEEEWERQMKKELEAKKEKPKFTERVYSKDELKTISSQNETRSTLHSLFSSFTAILTAMSALISADCSVGNECLPTLSPSVVDLNLQTLNVPAKTQQVIKSTLVSLCSCVYEMEESSALPLANAIVVTNNGTLPSPSDARAPPLRSAMSECVLSLLTHDRSKQFSNPSCVETLCNIYGENNTTVSSGDLNPLLTTQGALGPKACRIASLKALETISAYMKLKGNPLVESRVFVNCFSDDGMTSDTAKSAFKAINEGQADAPCSKLLAIPLISLLPHSDPSIASAAAKALADMCAQHPGTISTVLKKITENYVENYPTVFSQDSSSSAPKKKGKAPSKKALESQFTMDSGSDEKGKDSDAKATLREGVCRAVVAIGDNSGITMSFEDVKLVIEFFVCSYCLADPSDAVRALGVDGGRNFVNTFGKEHVEQILPLFEEVLKTGVLSTASIDTSKSVSSVWAVDFRKEGAVVLLGSAATHLGDENPKVFSTVEMLLGALDTPSESVQSSVASCLAPLMKKSEVKAKGEEILTDLIKKCLKEPSLAKRKGAAYGISAAVKGLGISSLKKFDVIQKLQDAASCTYAVSKEGALFAIELLCNRLGLLFEPYIIVLLPALLKCFGDSNDHVREAAETTAGLIMSKLSAHGVKLVMPAVLTAFDEDQWRTKQASIRMLGSMSNCAPKQLSACLPRIIPKLTEAFSNTHPKVKASAEEALNMIVKVIRNPEVAGLSKVLLKALVDPSNFTKKGLEGLLETEFLHAIDAPSLALLIPVLQRGLKDKSGVAKRQSALITGNMITMINDPKDFIPYLDTLLPGLKGVLLDPIPDVRTTASKSIGSLVRGLGESNLDDLRPWLMATLKGEEGSTVERSGAAQGLSEYLVACGGEVVFDVMSNEIIPMSTHPKVATREGVLWVMTFMPNVLGQGYSNLIDLSLPALLGGLSDDNENVREVAMRAGRVLIRSHGKTSVDKILPALEEGLINQDWRIRQASLGLIGDLLSLIGGTTVAGLGEIGNEDDTRGAERAQAQIALVLGAEARKRVLASLYMTRSDGSSVVRQGAVQVWKTVVSVTARVLREILDILVAQVVKSLASEDAERTTVAGRCLGDIVKKLGDTVLPEIIPILQNALYTGDSGSKRGVCIGLAEIIEGGTKEQIAKFMDALAPAVRDALCDEDEGVRMLAAGCFQQLYNTVGGAAVQETIVPSLLVRLDKGGEVGDKAVLGLKEVLRVRSRELLPYLIPKLLGGGNLETKNASILAAVVEATGRTIHTHLVTIVPAVTIALSEVDEEDEEGRKEELEGVVRSLSREIEEVNLLVGELAKKCGSEIAKIRKAAVWMMGCFAEERKDMGDFTDDVPIMLREILSRLNDEHEEVVAENFIALKKVMSCVPAEEMVNHLDFSRNLINSLVSEARRKKGGVGDGLFLMPGFNRVKGLEPMLPMYHQGILYGGAGGRETAATGLAELVEMTDSKYLAAGLVVKMVGPLIRVVNDRNVSNVKCSILTTLHVILKKAGAALRAFTPQLQTTFLKSLSDTSRSVRTAAIAALGDLMVLATRVDPLINELTNLSLGAETATAVKTACLEALSLVLKNGGKKSKKEEIVGAALEASKELVNFGGDEGVRLAAGKVMGSVVGLCIAIKSVCENLDLEELGDSIVDGWVSEVVNAASDVSVKADLRTAGFLAFGSLMNVPNIKSFVPTVVAGLGQGENMGGAGSMDDINKSCLLGCKKAGLREPGLFLSGPGGIKILTAALMLSKLGNSQIQYSANKFLWVGLEIGEGMGGVDVYAKAVGGENARLCRDLGGKVIAKLKNAAEED